MSVESAARKGFTIVELIIVVAIFALAASSLIPFSGKFTPRQNLKSYRIDVVDTLRRAQHQAVSYEGNTAWGVKFHSGSYVLFSGNSYAVRNTTHDKTRSLLSGYAFSGLSEVVFARGTGETATGGTIFISHTDSQLQTQIDINARGTIMQNNYNGSSPEVYAMSSSASATSSASITSSFVSSSIGVSSVGTTSAFPPLSSSFSSASITSSFVSSSIGPSSVATTSAFFPPLSSSRSSASITSSFVSSSMGATSAGSTSAFAISSAAMSAASTSQFIWSTGQSIMNCTSSQASSGMVVSQCASETVFEF